MTYDPSSAKEALLKLKSDNKAVRDIWNGRARSLPYDKRKNARLVVSKWFRAADLVAVLSFDLPRLEFLLQVAEVEGATERIEVNQKLIAKIKAQLPAASDELKQAFDTAKATLGDVS